MKRLDLTDTLKDTLVLAEIHAGFLVLLVGVRKIKNVYIYVFIVRNFEHYKFIK